MSEFSAGTSASLRASGLARYFGALFLMVKSARRVAHEILAGKHKRGKIVLTVDGSQ